MYCYFARPANRCEPICMCISTKQKGNSKKNHPMQGEKIINLFKTTNEPTLLPVVVGRNPMSLLIVVAYWPTLPCGWPSGAHWPNAGALARAFRAGYRLATSSDRSSWLTGKIPWPLTCIKWRNGAISWGSKSIDLLSTLLANTSLCSTTVCQANIKKDTHTHVIQIYTHSGSSTGMWNCHRVLHTVSYDLDVMLLIVMPPFCDSTHRLIYKAWSYGLAIAEIETSSRAHGVLRGQAERTYYPNDPKRISLHLLPLWFSDATPIWDRKRFPNWVSLNRWRNPRNGDLDQPEAPNSLKHGLKCQLESCRAHPVTHHDSQLWPGTTVSPAVVPTNHPSSVRHWIGKLCETAAFLGATPWTIPNMNDQHRSTNCLWGIHD